VVCWTWYPIRNADWLRAHADRPPGTWATAQGIATLPLAAVGCIGFWLYDSTLADAARVMPLGPTPLRFVALMLSIGLFASWLGTLCWNEASQRLPTRLAGQLIVFETLSALAYAYLLRGQAPPAATLAGVALLLTGIAWALRARPQAAAAEVPH
jgi:drug/metabolite transporter (DMT)-like permease